VKIIAGFHLMSRSSMNGVILAHHQNVFEILCLGTRTLLSASCPLYITIMTIEVFCFSKLHGQVRFFPGAQWALLCALGDKLHHFPKQGIFSPVCNENLIITH
jgi:hypothetical protein